MFLYFNGLFKGQTISKANHGVLNSPKKTNVWKMLCTENYLNVRLVNCIRDLLTLKIVSTCKIFKLFLSCKSLSPI